MSGEEEEYTQGYKLFVMITLASLTKVKFEVRHNPRVLYLIS